MDRLFGTDGIRGVANADLDVSLAMELGLAGAHVLAGHFPHRPRILIGRDTRVSGDMLEAALAAGMNAAGADVYSAGVLTTPAVSYLVANQGYDAGVMISASHNPYEYNGIKLFDEHGNKLADSVEDEIEAAIRRGDTPRPLGIDLGRRYWVPDSRLLYSIYLKTKLGSDLSGMHIALDCANGSAASVAPGIFRDLGAKLELIGVDPDGLNINANAGSTNMDNLEDLVLAKGCDLGFAFDGDADRMLAIDSAGNRLDGDQIMAFIARYLKDLGELEENTIVATVMSNLGFEKYCEKYGFVLRRAAVGDRYVREEMEQHGYSLGGEQSGHVILSRYANSGDGILTALCLLRALKHFDVTLEEALADYVLYPQVLKQIRVENGVKKALMEDGVVREAHDRIEAELSGTGRILLRPSGTEPSIRVMVEGEDYESINAHCDCLLDVLATRAAALGQ